MDARSESAKSPRQILLVGASEWRRTATAAFEDGSHEVIDSVASLSDVGDDRLGGVDILVTNDRETLSTASGPPIVYAAESTELGRSKLDTLLADGADEVITDRTTQGLYEHRLRRAIELVSERRSAGDAHRTRYRKTLEGIREATSHLLTVESKQAAYEYIVDAASDVLGLAGVVYRFDEQDSELVPTACSPDLEAVIGSPPRLRPRDDSITWRTFVSGMPSVYDDVRNADAVYDETTALRSGLYVPLGEHGVLVAASTDPGKFDEDLVELARLFATVAEATLDRIGRTRRLHDREQKLERQNEHLERLNATSRVRQEIEQHLLLAESREEIERGICARLTELEGCSMVWIGEPDPGGNCLRPRSRVGRGQDYFDAVTVTTADDSAAEPAGRAVRTETPIYVENVAASVHDGTWRAEALSHSFQSVYAVPLVHDGFLYGVLSLYGDEYGAFDDELRTMLAELGETIAYTIAAVNRKTALVEDDRTEIELELDGGSVLTRLSRELDARVEFEGRIQHEEATVVFASVDRPIAGSSELETIGGIESASVIESETDETLLQLELSEPFLGSVVDGYGGTVRAFVAETRRTWALVDVPTTVAVREVVSTLDRHGIAASMIARRERSNSDLSSLDASGRNRLLDRFTDRQREVVQTAYHSGFFDWPRRATGEEIADSLGISSPAFHKHVRATERKLFESLFDDRG
ncbi:GAF domain-containing protein [Natrialbaceae archaeon A-arb3/5]